MCDVDWQTEIGSRNVDEAITFVYETLYKCPHKNIPTKTVENGKRSYSSWYSKSLINIIREKDQAHRKWKDYDEFSLLMVRCHRIHTACCMFVDQNSIKKNSKIFWFFAT